MNKKGCDIASYQGTVDFDRVKDEISFVIAKSSEGTGYRDPTFLRNWNEAKRVGIQRGAYHFARPDLGTNAQDEAAYFLSSIPLIDSSDLLALDYEVNWDGDVVAWCLSFLNLVKQMTSISPYIYLNMSLVNSHDWSPVIDAGYPLWLAYYDDSPNSVLPTPWPIVSIKQWTSDGTVSGISGRVDLNTAFEDLGGEEDMALRDDFENLKGIVEEQDNTIKEMKKTYNPLYQHFHFDESTPPRKTSTPLIPPVEGAEYSGSSVDLSQVMWRFPDGTMHTYIDGKEAT